MPWRLKRRVALTLMGCAAIVVGAIVLALNRDLASDLLAAVAIVGGLAIIINALPDNGNGQ